MQVTKRDCIALIVAMLMGAVSIWYCYLSVTGKIEPVLSTWLLFFLASSLGLWTYINAGKSERSFAVNINNSADVVFTGVILACLLYLKADAGFTPFGVFCIGLAGAVFAYYLLRRNAAVANIAVNSVLTIAYFPTFERLWNANHNTESFGIWLTVWVAQVFALYNPLKARDLLAIIYASRAFVLVSSVLVLMFRLQFAH